MWLRIGMLFSKAGGVGWQWIVCGAEEVVPIQRRRPIAVKKPMHITLGSSLGVGTVNRGATEINTSGR